MTISRLLTLQLVLAVGFGSLVLVPRHPKIQPASVNMDLPETIGMWTGHDEAVTEKELTMLAPDTEFARKIYNDPFGNSIWVSVVLSGYDLDNSIHRPERCLPAQGWTIVSAQTTALPVKEAPGGQLKVMRLYNSRPTENSGGQVVPIHNLNYYWFVGGHELTSSHMARTMIDIRDRLFFGRNQRWAYITVAATVTEGLPGVSFGKSEDETNAMLREFVQRIFPHIVKPEAITAPQKVSSKSQTPANAG